MERRRAPRRIPGRDESLSRVRLRTGRELAVIDLSTVGALVEGSARLLPGTHVDVHVMTRDGRVLVRSRVSRASVFRLQADLVMYRAALAFDRTIDTRRIEAAVLHTNRGMMSSSSHEPTTRVPIASLAMPSR